MKERIKGIFRALMSALGGGSAIAAQDVDETGAIEMDDGTTTEPLLHDSMPPRH